MIMSKVKNCVVVCDTLKEFQWLHLLLASVSVDIETDVKATWELFEKDVCVGVGEEKELSYFKKVLIKDTDIVYLAREVILNKTEFKMLKVLVIGSKYSTKELAAILDRDRTNIQKSVKKLIDLDYIKVTKEKIDTGYRFIYEKKEVCN